MTEQHHVYKNSCDWFVATSREHAAALARTRYHEKEEAESDDDLDLDFTQVPDDEPMTFYSDEDGNRDETDPSGRTKTAAEWAFENGIGILSSQD